MSNRFLTDKSLAAEARQGGWSWARPRGFAEPGVVASYPPSFPMRILHGDVSLTIDPEAGTLRGEATFQLQALPGGGERWWLQLDELEVDEVAGPTGPLPFDHRDGRVSFAACERVTVRWHGSPTRGLYFVGPRAAAPDRSHEAWTQCQDEDAHFVFPCHDHPSAKHTWRFGVSAGQAYTVVGNGRREGESWVVDAPMPAYLATIVLLRATVVAGESPVPLRYVVPEGTDRAAIDRAFGRTPRMMAFLQEKFGPYPWARYDQVVVHDFIFGGMENLGATTLVDLVLTDERAALDWDADDLVVHELAHQWFGDLVTCQDWSQGWLNEGWATWTEHLWMLHDRGPEEGTWHLWEMLGNYLEECEGRYTRPIVSYQFRAPIDVFDRHLYEKGALVLHALKARLGGPAFWAGVALYLERHRGGTVHTRHFQRAMEDATGQNLDRFFAEFIQGAGHPVVEVKLAHADGRLSVAVAQKQEGDGVTPAFAFPLVLEIDGRKVELAVDGRERTFVLPLAEAPGLVVVDPGMGGPFNLTVSAPRSWLEAMLRGAPCPVARLRAARALQVEGSPGALASLRQALRTDRFWGVRAAIADLLGRSGHTADVEALLGALGEPEPRARRAVVAALGATRAPRAADALAGLATDPSLHVEGEVCRALGRIRDERARARALALLDQPSWGETLAARALEALGSLRDPSLAAILEAWTDDDRPDRARAAAASALARLADEVESCRLRAVEVLTHLAEHGPLRVAVAALGGLTALRDGRAVPALTRVHRGARDGRCRRLAWEALAAIAEGRTSDAGLQAVRARVDVLSDENRRLRERLERLEPAG